MATNKTTKWVQKLRCQICQKCRTVRSSENELYCKRCQTEAQQAFAEYGQPVLSMMIDKGEGDGALSCKDFESKYGVEKKTVNFALIMLQIALEKEDLTKRNEIYDFLMEIL